MSNPFEALGPLMAGFQQRIEQIKEEAGQMEVEGQAGGGLVKVVANGKQEVLKVTVDASAAEDREMLEDLIVAATNDALRQSKEQLAQKMSALTGGLPLPPGLL